MNAGSEARIAAAVDVVATVVGNEGRVEPLHQPHFAGREWEYVKDCLDTGWVSSVGAYVDRIEGDLAALCGVRRAVATMNGTAALHMGLMLCGVGPDDEVLCPALTFVATANAVAYCGATPHFLDSELDTLGLDPDAMDRRLGEVAERTERGARNRHTGRRIAAVVPMHTFGHPCLIDEVVEVARSWGVAVVEDAAEALGSTRGGRPVGGRGTLGAVSFNGNKIVTTGGGGALLTDDDALADRAKYLTTTAKDPHRWNFYHREVGYNYRLPNINAALGCAQLEQLAGFVTAKRELAARYERAFRDVDGVAFVSEPEGTRSNYWLNAIMFDHAGDRDNFLAASNDRGLLTRPCWALMCDLPMFADAPSAPLPVAKTISERLVNLPSSVHIALDGS